jgi:hypothetical protein
VLEMSLNLIMAQGLNIALDMNFGLGFEYGVVLVRKDELTEALELLIYGKWEVGSIID